MFRRKPLEAQTLSAVLMAHAQPAAQPTPKQPTPYWQSDTAPSSRTEDTVVVDTALNIVNEVAHMLKDVPFVQPIVSLVQR